MEFNTSVNIDNCLKRITRSRLPSNVDYLTLGGSVQTAFKAAIISAKAQRYQTPLSLKLAEYLSLPSVGLTYELLEHDSIQDLVVWDEIEEVFTPLYELSDDRDEEVDGIADEVLTDVFNVLFRKVWSKGKAVRSIDLSFKEGEGLLLRANLTATSSPNRECLYLFFASVSMNMSQEDLLALNEWSVYHDCSMNEMRSRILSLKDKSILDVFPNEPVILVREDLPSCLRDGVGILNVSQISAEFVRFTEAPGLIHTGEIGTIGEGYATTNR